MITPEILSKMAGRPVNEKMQAIVKGLQWGKGRGGLDEPAVLAQFLAQLAHESARFKYNEEIWGPTEAQKRYEGRADLGNVIPGDGYRFRGRGPIQVTGRYNYRKLTEWLKGEWPEAPDLTKNPDLLLSDPWEGVSPIWYWDTHQIEAPARAGDISAVTRRINGGLNGYADRLLWYSKVALVLLGYEPDEVRKFQSANGLTVDGIPGPNTRKAMHEALSKMPKIVYEEEIEVTEPPVVIVAKTEREIQYETALKGIQDILIALQLD